MVTTNEAGQIVRKGEAARSLASQLIAMKPEIAKALPKHLDAERMARISMTALRLTPNLNKCTLPSFLGSVLQLAQLGLEPNSGLGHAYLVPYKRGNVYECKILIGYAGMIDIAYRSGKVALVYAEVVHEGDVFDYDLGLNRKLIHKPIGDEDGPMLYTYSVAELTNGHKAFAVLTAKQVLKRKNSAQGTSKSSSPWMTFEEEMWKKSAVRQLFKYLPKSVELAQVSAIDAATEHGQKQTELLDDDVTSVLRAHSIDVDGDETPADEDV